MLALVDLTHSEPWLFNIAYSVALRIRELIETVAALVPGARWRESLPGEAPAARRKDPVNLYYSFALNFEPTCVG